MGIYKLVSINEVMSSIISKTRLADSSWYADMIEWTIEGYKLFKLRQPLYTTSTDVEVVDHTADLPCALVSLDAVTHDKYRLRETQNVLDVKRHSTIYNEPVDFFVATTETTKITTTEPITEVTTSVQTVRFPIADYKTFPFSDCNYYKLFPGYIQTSFKTGCVTMYYTTYPVDNDGYLLIPDNTDLKLALYYYVLQNMIGAGYKASMFSFQDAMNLFEKHAGRAINQIKQPSPDKMEELKQVVVRLVQPLHYHQSLLSNPNL